MKKLILLLIFIVPLAKAQTNTFCANNLPCTIPGAWVFQGNNTHSGTETFTNTLTAVSLDGCQHVNASQTFAAALAAASAPGCIAVDPGTYTVSANASIGATVQLVSQSGGILSIATGVTLTINGPIIAPPLQIFAYVGTGVVSLGNNAVFVHAIWFPGSDMMTQIQNTYNALASGGQTIYVDPQTNGACWSSSHTANFSTVGKQVTIAGSPDGGTCINETRTGGSSTTITNISEAGNTVTATSSLNPGANNFVTVSGYTGASLPYNGTYKVIASSGTQFTYTENISGLAGDATTQTATLPVSTFIVDYGSNGGSSYVQAGFRDIILSNNGCAVNGGCGNATIGINIGPVNGGGGQLSFERLNIGGFGVGELFANGNAFACQHQQIVYTRNTMGVYAPVTEEGEHWTNGMFIFNSRGLVITGGEYKLDGTHCDSQTVMCADASGGVIEWNDPHFENLGTTNGHYLFTQAGNIIINGGLMLDDQNSGNNDYYFNCAGASDCQAYGLGLETLGRTSSNIFSFGQAGEVHLVVLAGSFGANPVCPNFSTTVICTLTTNAGATPFINTPKVGLGTTGSPVSVVASGSGGTTWTVPSITATAAAIIASGTSTMASGSVSAATCATAITTAAAGVATTDSIEWAYATAPTLTTDALLHISPYVTSGNVNFTRCNPTAGAIVGTAIVLNWRVIR